MSVNDPVKWQAELAVRVQPTVRERQSERESRRVQREVWWGGGYVYEVGGCCDSPCCHQRDWGPWVALSIPTWELCKWRGRAVIIYSPQLLTLDSALIAARGKSDWTWRVPEPVTLISVRCLQQEVKEEELAAVRTHVHVGVFVYFGQVGSWRHGWMTEPWLKMTRW